MATQDSEQQLIELRKELLLISGAEAALENAAIVACLDGVEQSSIDALLNPDLSSDERTEWKLKATAQAMRKIKRELQEMADSRSHVEQNIKALEER